MIGGQAQPPTAQEPLCIRPLQRTPRSNRCRHFIRLDRLAKSAILLCVEIGNLKQTHEQLSICHETNPFFPALWPTHELHQVLSSHKQFASNSGTVIVERLRLRTRNPLLRAKLRWDILERQLADNEHQLVIEQHHLHRRHSGERRRFDIFLHPELGGRCWKIPKHARRQHKDDEFAHLQQ